MKNKKIRKTHRALRGVRGEWRPPPPRRRRTEAPPPPATRVSLEKKGEGEGRERKEPPAMVEEGEKRRKRGKEEKEGGFSRMGEAPFEISSVFGVLKTNKPAGTGLKQMQTGSSRFVYYYFFFSFLLEIRKLVQTGLCYYFFSIFKQKYHKPCKTDLFLLFYIYNF